MLCHLLCSEMAIANVPTSITYTCNVCGLMGFDWQDPGVVPPVHLSHEMFSVYCHACDLTFLTPSSANRHLAMHADFNAAPVTSTHRSESLNRIPETPATPCSTRDVSSLSPILESSHSSASLPLAQQPPRVYALFFCAKRTTALTAPWRYRAFALACNRHKSHARFAASNVTYYVCSSNCFIIWGGTLEFRYWFLPTVGSTPPTVIGWCPTSGCVSNCTNSLAIIWKLVCGCTAQQCLN